MPRRVDVEEYQITLLEEKAVESRYGDAAEWWRHGYSRAIAHLVGY
jgi:hypothetical protein